MITTLFLSTLLCAAPPPAAKAASTAGPRQRVTSPLGFEVLLPAGFERVAAESGDIKHVWAFATGKPEFMQISVQAYSSVIGQECAPPDKLPPTVKGFTAKWAGLSVCGMRLEQTSDAGPMLDLLVEVPLAGAAIAIHVTGFPKNEATLRATLDDVLNNLTGATNWRVAFGCFTLDIPPGWGTLKGTPEKVGIARRAPFMIKGEEWRPRFHVATQPWKGVSLDAAEASTLEGVKAKAKGEVTMSRTTFAGVPASELRWTSSEKGLPFVERMLVFTDRDNAFLVSTGIFEGVLADVEPVATKFVASARNTCSK